ncbi:indole-3-glycerol phosphate synthase TrpC [Clostridium tertium]
MLEKIVKRKRATIEERKSLISEEELYNKAIELGKNKKDNLFKKEIFSNNLTVIGEFKKASPSKGVIVKDFNLEKILSYYNDLNIDAFSILTEETFFLGSDENLKFIRKNSNKPILRKDFIVDFYQIYEAVFLGADSILLIASVLKEDLSKFYKEAKKFNLEPLVEVHNEEEVKLSVEANCEIIGVNNRNLRNFNTSTEVTKNLINSIPRDKAIVAESGLLSIEDIQYMKNLGVNGVLIGEMFMRNIENRDFIKKFKEFRKINFSLFTKNRGYYENKNMWYY